MIKTVAFNHLCFSLAVLFTSCVNLEKPRISDSIENKNAIIFDSTKEWSRWQQKKILYFVEKPEDNLNVPSYYQIIEKAFDKWASLVNIKIKKTKNLNKSHVAFIWEDDINSPLWPGVQTFAITDMPYNDPNDKFSEDPKRNYIIYTNTKYSLANSEKHSWSLSGEKNSLDFETVTIHEIGHLMGMRHCENKHFWTTPCDTESIMYKSIQPGIIKRELSKTDKMRIKTFYGI